MLEGWEWLIIGVVAIVIIMWGPAKIPEFARAIGRAKGEFDKASKEFRTAATEVSTAPASTAYTLPKTPAIKSKDEILIETARNLGISTDGKPREEITGEIAKKIKALSA